jgi:hypothetical protein
VAVCEGYLGIEPHWDLWKHLFRGELFTESLERGCGAQFVLVVSCFTSGGVGRISTSPAA